MTLIQVITLALIQGITEFLPVSSSAHLILLPALFSWQDQGLAFDCIVHLGTLTAVLYYFRADIFAMLYAFFAQFRRPLTPQQRPSAHLANAVILATLPVALVGALAHTWIEAHLRHPEVLAWTTLIFGLLLGAADHWAKQRKTLDTLSLIDILCIGCAQALALIPGTSRSGITLTAALALGYKRETAARFSFLLSIPVITLAGGLSIFQLLHQAESVPISLLLIGFVVSAVAAYLCICTFMKLLQHVGMWPYVLYRIVLAVVLLLVFRK